jgi:hypothetical protein
VAHVRTPRLTAVLIIPPGHAEAVRARWQPSAREKWMIGGVLGAVAVLAAVLVISLASSGPSSKSGCIYATVPAATGAEQINLCGARARSTCATVQTPGAYAPQAAQSIAAECRKAGLPVGSS